MGSDVRDFEKGLVAEMMKVHTLYARQGLELRVDRLPDFDGFRVGAKMPEREARWLDIGYLPGQMGYAQIEEAVAQVRAYVEDAGPRVLIPKETA